MAVGVGDRNVSARYRVVRIGAADSGGAEVDGEERGVGEMSVKISYRKADFVWVSSHWDYHLEGLCRYKGKLCRFNKGNGRTLRLWIDFSAINQPSP